MARNNPDAASEEALYDAAIDAGCNEDVTFERAIRRLRAMSETEAKYKPDFNYVNTVQRGGMSTSWREAMITWYHQLQDTSGMHSGTIYVAVNYMDRFLSRKSCDKPNFQLLAIGALFLATKVEEPKPMKTEDLADLSERLFEPADLRVMEIEMLTTLQWLLHPPTTLSFVSLLACLFEASYDVVENITERASQLVNVALYDMEFLKYGASLQAMTALICVMRHLNLPDPQVKRWLQRTNHCGFDYTLSEDADSLVRDCGVRFMDILRRLTIDDSVDDAEVEEAMELQNHDDGDDDARGHQPRVTPAPRSDTPGGAPPTTAHQQGTNGATRSALREPSPNDVTADVDQSFTQAVAKSALYLDDADDASAAL